MTCKDAGSVRGFNSAVTICCSAAIGAISGLVIPFTRWTSPRLWFGTKEYEFMAMRMKLPCSAQLQSTNKEDRKTCCGITLRFAWD